MHRQQQWRDSRGLEAKSNGNLNISIVLRVTLIVVTQKSKIAMTVASGKKKEAEMMNEGQNTEKLREKKSR